MRRYIIAAAIAIPLLGVVFLATGYANDEVIGTPRISRGVTALDLDLSRLTHRDAAGLIAAYEANLVSQPLTVVVEGDELVLDPADVEFSIDEDAVAAEALVVRRSPELTANIGRWFATFG